jgi:hypothetical protein
LPVPYRINHKSWHNIQNITRDIFNDLVVMLTDIEQPMLEDKDARFYWVWVSVSYVLLEVMRLALTPAGP